MAAQQQQSAETLSTRAGRALLSPEPDRSVSIVCGALRDSKTQSHASGHRAGRARGASLNSGSCPNLHTRRMRIQSRCLIASRLPVICNGFQSWSINHMHDEDEHAICWHLRKVTYARSHALPPTCHHAWMHKPHLRQHPSVSTKITCSSSHSSKNCRIAHAHSKDISTYAASQCSHAQTCSIHVKYMNGCDMPIEKENLAIVINVTNASRESNSKYVKELNLTGPVNRAAERHLRGDVK
eukprot:5718404-Pleurochrysis_carterae.AAC.1